MPSHTRCIYTVVTTSSAPTATSSAPTAPGGRASSSTVPPDAADLAGGRCVAGALRRAARAVTRHYDEHLAPSGLTIARFSLLSTLARMGTPTLAAYARDLAMDRTTLLRNLRAVADEGLVAVEPARGGRSKTARLTGRGAAALRRATPYWEAAQRALGERVEREDVERVLSLASKLNG